MSKVGEGARRIGKSSGEKVLWKFAPFLYRLSEKIGAKREGKKFPVSLFNSVDQLGKSNRSLARQTLLEQRLAAIRVVDVRRNACVAAKGKHLEQYLRYNRR